MIPLHWLGTILSEEKALQCLASLVAQLVKNLPAMWETWVRSLGWEEPLEKGKATYWGPAPAGSRDIQSMMVSATERLIER